MKNRRFKTIPNAEKIVNLAGYAARYYFDQDKEPEKWKEKRKDIIKQLYGDMKFNSNYQYTICGTSKGPDIIYICSELTTIVCLGADLKLVQELEG